MKNYAAEKLGEIDFREVHQQIWETMEPISRALLLENHVWYPNMDFEPLLYVTANAYERKTDREWDYVPPYNIETYANEDGWAETGRKFQLNWISLPDSSNL